MLTSTATRGVAIVRKHWIKLSVVIALITAYGLAGFLWVPKLIREQAITLVETRLHRNLTLGDITFNPFTLTARIHDIKLTDTDKSRIASINDLLVNAELSSVWHRAMVFKQVRIDSPSINAIIDSRGNLNLVALKPDRTAESKSSSPLPRIHIGTFELLSGELKLVDHSRPQTFDVELKPITFTLQNFRTEGNHENAFRFAATSDEKEALDWRGDFTVQPFAASGALKVTGLKAATIQSYLQDKLPFVLNAGAVDVDGKYQLVTDKHFDISLALTNIHASNLRVQPRNTNGQQAEQKDWLTLPQVNVTDTAISLHDRAVSIKSIEMDDADIQAWLDEHRQLNLLQLLHGHNDDKADGKWNTRVTAINMNRATIHAEDRAVQPAAKFTVSAAQVQLHNFNTAPASSMDVNVQMNINDNGQLHAQGKIRLDTLNTALQLQLTNFTLTSLQSYAAQSTTIFIRSGSVNTEGSFTYKGSAAGPEPLMQYTGSMELNNVSTLDKADGGDFIKCQQLQLQSLRYAMAPDQVRIDKIVARQPYGHLAINADTTTNVQQALRLQPSTNKDASKTEVKPADKGAPRMKIQIAKVVIENGAADFSDASIEPSFAIGLEHMEGEVTELSTNANSRATVKLQGSVDNYAPATINGQINFLAAAAFSDLSMEFRNIDLTAFNPYSGKFAGYNIAKGKLATQLHYSIVDRKLDAHHHIVLDQLEFGKATESKDAVSLPVKLAVALLKDRNGVIELDLPISGSLDDPEFHAGPLVWQTLRSLLSKIVASPFAALGSLLGGSSEELAFVEFSPGSAVLADAEKDKLNKLAHALVERPQLKLDIPLTTVTDTDVRTLSQARIDEAVAKHLANAASATSQQHLDALTAIYKEKTGNLPEFSTAADKKNDVTELRIAALQKQLLPLYAINDDERSDLAGQRADAVQALLLSNTELSAERIYKVTTEPSKSPAGVVRMELKLE